MKDIPGRMRDARKAAGISAAKMAYILGVSRRTITRIETFNPSHPYINTDYIQVYAGLSSVSVEEILLGYDPQKAIKLAMLKVEEIAEVINRTAERTLSQMQDKSQQAISDIYTDTLANIIDRPK